jgi:hypothetical protein
MRPRHWRLGRPGAGSLLIVLALLIGMVLTGIGGPAPAGAAPTSPTYRFSLDIASPRNTLCVGEKVTYLATVFADPQVGTPIFVEVPGVTVEAYANDKTVGYFDRNKNAAVVRHVTGSLGVEPPAAEFTFTAANKPGKTTLVFQGLVKGFDAATGYVSFSVGIRVIPCSYKVTTTTRYPVNYTHNPDIPSPAIVARMNTITITGDNTGHFTGEGDVVLVGGTKTVGCSVTERFAARGHATISGDIFDDGSLVLNFTYERVASDVSERCGPARVGSSVPYFFDALKVSLRQTGGVKTLPSTFNAGSFTGSTTAAVTLVKK